MFSNFFRQFRSKNCEIKSELHRVCGIPTVKFDPSRVTQPVKDVVRSTIVALPEIDQINFEKIYEAAIRSILAGRALRLLFEAIMGLNIAGMTKARAADIARLLNNRATSHMNCGRQISLGITHAIWLYAGAPCMVNLKKPTDQDIQQDAAHRAADGKEFEIAKGMYLNGKWTWPGFEPGCKCISRL